MGQMLCNWVEPSGLVKAACDCHTLSSLPVWVDVLSPKILLVRRFWFFPGSPGDLSSPLFSTIHPPSGLGTDNQAQNPKTSRLVIQEGSPKALAAEGAYLHYLEALDTDTLGPQLPRTGKPEVLIVIWPAPFPVHGAGPSAYAGQNHFSQLQVELAPWLLVSLGHLASRIPGPE